MHVKFSLTIPFCLISKNKQNGRHFKTEIRLNTSNLEFVAKYGKSKEPDQTSYKITKSNTFTSGKGGKEIPVHIERNTIIDATPTSGNLFDDEDIQVEVPTIL